MWVSVRALEVSSLLTHQFLNTSGPCDSRRSYSRALVSFAESPKFVSRLARVIVQLYMSQRSGKLLVFDVTAAVRDLSWKLGFWFRVAPQLALL